MLIHHVYVVCALLILLHDCALLSAAYCMLNNEIIGFSNLQQRWDTISKWEHLQCKHISTNLKIYFLLNHTTLKVASKYVESILSIKYVQSCAYFMFQVQSHEILYKVHCT